MKAFATYHPLINFIYFVAVIGFACFLMHPLCVVIGFLTTGICLFLLRKNKLWLYLLPMMVATAFLNPIFNHQGVTLLGYLPDGNPLTLESILYGIVAAGMIGSVMGWFSCYNEVLTSDKFVYLFGRILPSLSLVFSMVLRFVPRFINQFRIVANAQQGLGRDLRQGNLLVRAKNGLKVLSIVMTWALENAIDTADSMKARGYGQKKRTAFSIYTFTRRDGVLLFWMLLLGGYTLAGALGGALSFTYFPMLLGRGATAYSCSVFLAYLGLCICPVILEIKERRTWSTIKSKM